MRQYRPRRSVKIAQPLSRSIGLLFCLVFGLGCHFAGFAADAQTVKEKSPAAEHAPAAAPTLDGEAHPASQARGQSYADRAAAAQAHLDALPKEIEDEALRAKVAEQWKEALVCWQAAQQASEQLARRRKTIDGAPARLQAIEGEDQALRKRAASPEAADAGHSLADLEAELRELDVSLPELNKQLSERVSRNESQGQRLAESRKNAEAAQARLAAKPDPIPEDIPEELKTALREAQSARRRADNEIVANSEYYRNIQEPLAQLDNAERTLLSHRVEFGKSRREHLAKLIAEKRREEADRLRRESEAAAARVLGALPDDFREVAAENDELTKTLNQILAYENRRNTYLQTADENVDTLHKDYERIREQLESGGGGRNLGTYLWAKRRSLQRDVYQARKDRESLLGGNIMGLSLASLDELRRTVPRLEKELAAFSARPDVAARSEAERNEIIGQARKILDYHAKLVASLSDAVSRHAAALIDLDSSGKELQRISRQYTALAERYVLELPGSPPLWRISLPNVLKGVGRDIAGTNLWRETGVAFISGLLTSPWLLVLLAAAFAPGFLARLLGKLKWFRNIARHAPLAGSPRGLLWRLGKIALGSYQAPLAMFVAGAAIWRTALPTSAAAALGEAFLLTVVPWLLVNLWRHFCDADGILEVYARTPPPLCQRLGRRLTALALFGVPLWAVVCYALNRTEPPEYQSLGSVLSMLLAGLAVGFWLLRMRPAVLMRDCGRTWKSVWQALHLTVMVLGVVWLGMSLMGYNYGAVLVIHKAAVSGLIVTVLGAAALYWSLSLARSRERQRARAILFYRFGAVRAGGRRRRLPDGADRAEAAVSPRLRQDNVANVLDKTPGAAAPLRAESERGKPGSCPTLSVRNHARSDRKNTGAETGRPGPASTDTNAPASGDGVPAAPAAPAGPLPLCQPGENPDDIHSPAPVKAAAASIPPAVEQELSQSLTEARRLVVWLSVAALAGLLLWQWSDLFPVQEWLGKLSLWLKGDAKTVTLREVARALVGGLFCYLIANPLGAWFNLTFFGWNPGERGTRMATASLIRYAAVGAGLIWIAHELGMAWSDAQWLVAALSVGIGFGLQEIILNFVSGIILLFERPVRVGDTVTIGTADGTISRINIRTTTLLDANRRELIIPNKELITGRVVNWTLSDTVTRLVIPVTVAYGSDLEKVQQLLLEAADSLDEVLDDPAPTVFFVEMAGSGLNFELRVFTGRLDDRMPVQHQLYLTIDRLFKENGIERPYPQMDVHVRNA